MDPSHQPGRSANHGWFLEPKSVKIGTWRISYRENDYCPGFCARLKHGALIALFILVPFAGAFHPKLRKKENPEDKEIGAEK